VETACRALGFPAVNNLDADPRLALVRSTAHVEGAT
jgi:hypothetical protein